MQRFAEALKPFWLKTMPGIGGVGLSTVTTFAHLGLNLRRLGKKDLRDFMRIASLPARDLMDEYFENEILKATLSWDGLIGAKLAPRSPNGAVLALLYRMAGEPSGGHTIPTGGVNGLIEALQASATTSGAEITCGARVGRILES
jgi:phytoene dehydrogenase-like protein